MRMFYDISILVEKALTLRRRIFIPILELDDFL